MIHPNVRCRLVAKHVATKYGGKDAEDLFAAMPPFELIQSLLIKAVQRSNWKTMKRKVTDISKAHLCAPMDKGTSAYVDLPPECSKPETCGLLQYCLYGMRPASHGWEAEYTRQLEAIGFVAGVASPCCFHRASDDVACVVHGDDFTFDGEPSSLQEITKALANVWLVKIRGTLGPDPEDDKEIFILNRIARWEKDHLRYEADPRHVEKLTRDLGMEDCKSLTTPGTKAITSSTILDDVRLVGGDPSVAPVPEPLKLDRDGMKLYRSVVARCNYLLAHRYETIFTKKELCRSMSSPSVDDLTAIKRLCRFLKGLPRVVQRMDFSDLFFIVIKAYVDSDSAGCRKTRKSTSGGVLMLGATAVRRWSTNQPV